MMKTIKYYLVVFLTFILANNEVHAQYNGGIADASASDLLGLTSCPIPAHYYAYFGGFSDNANVDTASNTFCSTPPSFFAYMGGFSDTANVDTLDATTCGTPPSFFAYMGGFSDGANVDTTSDVSCGIPPQFYAYFGGMGDGFSKDEIGSCPVTPPDASFTASATTGCVGTAIDFTDTSTNIPFVWSWTFPGGTPATSTAQNPSVVYNTPGVYTVTFTATNYNGGDTVTMTDYITITATPTVVTTTSGSRCDSGSVQLGATASAGVLRWYNVATGGSILGSGPFFPTGIITTTTTFYVEAASGSCVSSRTAVVATVNVTPTVATTTPGSRCGTGSVTLSATASAGALSWFANASGGSALGTGTSFATPSIGINTTYYVQATNGTCVSARTAVLATVNAVPTVTSNTPGSRCDTGSVTLGATGSAGSTLNWYNVASGGTVLATGESFVTPPISSNTTFYVEASNGTCASTRTAVLATASITPAITATTPANRCDSGTLTLSATASAGTLNWYNVPTGGTSLGNGNFFLTPSISATTVYYVDASNGSCISARTPVIATVTTTPTVTATTPAGRCGSGSVTLGATASAGTLNWYGTAVGGTILGTGTGFVTGNITVTTIYYVEAINGTCTSPRTPVTATISIMPTIVTTTPASRCDIGVLTLAATASAGTLNWFDVATGGSSIGTGNVFVTPSISTTTTYYVQSTSGSCVSPRTAVTATVNATPSITATTPASRCDAGAVTLGATASSGTLNWYNVSTGGTSLGTGNSFVTGAITTTTTFYVESANGSCVSPRVAVVATVNTTPTITATTPGSRCDAGSVTLGATASSGTINWYGVAAGGSVLGTGTSFLTPSITTTTTFYAEVTNGNCTSARTAVIATVNATPTITGTTPGNRCGAGTVTLSASANIGILSWFNVATGGTALGTGTTFVTPSISTTTTYYVQAANASCISARTAVIATINTIPIITATTPASRCDAGSVALGATASAGTLNWYALPVGGAVLGTGTSFNTGTITTTTTFYAEAVSGSCTSTRTAVIATVNTTPTVVSTTPASRCDVGAVTLTASASAGTLSWYDVVTGGTALATGVSFLTPSISSTTVYYVEASNGSCMSSRTAVTATVNATPTVTATTPGNRCGAGTVTLGASVSAGTLNWYNIATGGTVLGTGTTFVTPSISATTTYYVEAVNGSCISPRLSVVATVNAIPTITSTTPASRCDSGTLTLSATANAGTLNWYNVPIGGTVLGNGLTFVTPSLGGTTTFYVEATNGSCTSIRTAVIATVNQMPVIVGTTSGSRCGIGTVLLGATASFGSLSWYNVPTGGTVLGTGNSFTTPIISATTNYYVESSNGTCVSVRQQVVATVNTDAIVITTAPGSRCGNGTVILGATSNVGLKWYLAATGGIAVAVGPSFETPVISATTTYYVEASNGDCTSITRTAVTATVNHVATPTGSSMQEFCAGQNVGELIVTEDNITWFDAPTNGNEVAPTTLLVAGTTYYASLSSGDCGSDTRLAVTVSLGACLGIDDIVRNELKLYPNPVNDILTIEYTANISRVEVVNMLGQIVFNKQINAGTTKVDMSSLAGGTYLVRVTADGLFKTYKVIKR